MKKLINLIFYILIFNFSSQAQLIDMIQGHIGTAIFPSDDYNRNTGYTENMFGGFAPAQILGLGLSKFITDKFIAGSTLEFMNTTKENNALKISKLSFTLKYNIISPDIYRFSPYIFASGNILYTNFTQSSHSITYTPEYLPQNIQITSVKRREPEFRYNAMVFGVSGGIGLDINVYYNYNIFGEAGYNYNFAKNSALQNEYTIYNKSNLIYYSLTAGLRVYLY